MPAAPPSLVRVHGNRLGRRARSALSAASALACLLAARSVLACPDCDLSRATRASIQRDPGFWAYVAAISLPFIIVGVAAALLYRIGRPSTAGGD